MVRLQPNVQIFCGQPGPFMYKNLFSLLIKGSRKTAKKSEQDGGHFVQFLNGLKTIWLHLPRPFYI